MNAKEIQDLRNGKGVHFIKYVLLVLSQETSDWVYAGSYDSQPAATGKAKEIGLEYAVYRVGSAIVAHGR